jgi:hypothetical protein
MFTENLRFFGQILHPQWPIQTSKMAQKTASSVFGIKLNFPALNVKIPYAKIPYLKSRRGYEEPNSRFSEQHCLVMGPPLHTYAEAAHKPQQPNMFGIGLSFDRVCKWWLTGCGPRCSILYTTFL